MLKDGQKVAFDTLLSNKNVFLTGDAGTGKSYVVNEFIKALTEQGKNVMVTAPTGIAALNIDGVTVHRAFKVPIQPLVEKIRSIPSELKDVDTVIVDEISMCRIDLFEYISKIMMYVNASRRKTGYKDDLQVVVVGDFFQLPPVITDRDRDILRVHYGDNLGNGFAFQSEYWDAFNFVNIVLTEPVRQNNNDFITALNMARRGQISCLSYFENNSCKTEIPNAIMLCGTNKAVKEKNEFELSKINSKLWEYDAIIVGEVKESDKVVDDTLRFKVGARVMTMLNESNGIYSNGSFGTIVKLGKESIRVRMDTGAEVDIYRNEWQIKSYVINNKSKNRSKGNEKKLDKEVVGTFTQFPLKLAYAITIHKSQGQTYDDVNLNPYCWDCGQLYVALSRIKDVKRMHLTNSLKPNFLKTSIDVVNFYNNIS